MMKGEKFLLVLVIITSIWCLVSSQSSLLRGFVDTSTNRQQKSIQPVEDKVVKSFWKLSYECAAHAKDIRWSTYNIESKENIAKLDTGTLKETDTPLKNDQQKIRILHVVTPYYTADTVQSAGGIPLHLDDSQHISLTTIELAKYWLKKQGKLILEELHTDLHIDTMAILPDFADKNYDRTPKLISLPESFLVSKHRFNTSAATAIKNHLHLNINYRNNIEIDPYHLSTKPLLREILKIAYEESQTKGYTHIIYTNMDINVLPSFYAKIYALLHNQGAFFINRVEIPEYKLTSPATFFLQESSSLNETSVVTPYQTDYPLTSIQNLHTSYEYAVHFQQNHPGFDCVVLVTSILPTVIENVGHVFIGYAPVGTVLNEAVSIAYRLGRPLTSSEGEGKDEAVATSNKPRQMLRRCVTWSSMHATFHIGSRNSKSEIMINASSNSIPVSLVDINGRLKTSRVTNEQNHDSEADNVKKVIWNKCKVQNIKFDTYLRSTSLRQFSGLFPESVMSHGYEFPQDHILKAQQVHHLKEHKRGRNSPRKKKMNKARKNKHLD